MNRAPTEHGRVERRPCQEPRGRVAFSILGLVLTLGHSACTSWRVEQTVPARSPELRVTLTDGSQVVLHEAGVEGDSLIGFARVALEDRSRHRRRAFAAADVRLLEKRRFEPVRTAALLVVTTGFVTYVTLYFGARGS